MNKQKVYFVQTGCVFNNEHFLPYAAGIIASYAFSNKEISSVYELADFIYKSENFDETMKSVKNPGVVAFSNYMWNFRFNLRLAEKIKEIYPECVIIFGGHQIDDTSEWLKKYSFIDFAIFGEGETAFCKILSALSYYGNFSDIPNISFRKENEIIKTQNKSSCIDINDIPSPYLSGVFDKIVKNSTDKFAAVIETSRGCPYHCAYCDWGDYNLPMRYFSAERVKKEIEWLGKNGIVFVTVADSNFGMRASDEEYVDKFISTKKEYGYPVAVEVAFAKKSMDHIFEMNRKLYENNMSRGATLSMQTLSPVALKEIGRENIPKEKFSGLLNLYAEKRIPSYTELILGLPGETYDSFCEGIEYLLENGQHNSIHVFYCEILPNSIMGNEEYIKKHGIKVLTRDFSLRNGMACEGISGESKIIVATNTMPEEMFLKSILYAFVIQVFHNFGLCRALALFFHYEKNMKYYEFYGLLVKWLENNKDSFVGRVFEQFSEMYKLSVKGEGGDTYSNTAFGETQFNLSDGAFLEFASNIEKFYDDITRFLNSFFNDKNIAEELIAFQKIIIRDPANKCTQQSFTYNWTEYYLSAIAGNPIELKKSPFVLKLFPSEEYKDLVSYAEAVAIKGRRIGKSIVLNDEGAFSVEFIKKEVTEDV